MSSNVLPSNKNRCKKMGIIGILFGYLGIHDFMAEKRGLGIFHLMLTFLPTAILIMLFIILFFSGFKCGTGDMSGCKTEADRAIEHTISALIDISRYAIPILFFGSWIWGAVEGIILLNSSKGPETSTPINARQ